MTLLGDLEFRNALYLAVFRGELTAADAALNFFHPSGTIKSVRNAG